MQDTIELVQEGAVAPKFSLPSTKGLVSSQDFQGQQNLVIYFMREFSCAICRGHANELAKLYPQLQAHNTEVVVIGGGSPKEAQNMADTYKLPFRVASDSERAVYQSFGLHKALGILQRSGSILVDKQGVIRYIQQSTLPTGALNKAELLKAVETL